MDKDKMLKTKEEIKGFLNRIDKIVYPDKNGTAVWYKRNRYDVIVGDVRYFFYDWEVIRLLEMFIELNKEKNE